MGTCFRPILSVRGKETTGTSAAVEAAEEAVFQLLLVL